MNDELLEPLDRVSQSMPHIRDLGLVGNWVGLLLLYPPLGLEPFFTPITYVKIFKIKKKKENEAKV